MRSKQAALAASDPFKSRLKLPPVGAKPGACELNLGMIGDPRGGHPWTGCRCTTRLVNAQRQSWLMRTGSPGSQALVVVAGRVPSAAAERGHRNRTNAKPFALVKPFPRPSFSP